MAASSRPRAARLPVDRYVVIGNPVAHSLSPEIHARFAAATGESLEYDRLLLPVEGFEAGARAFFAGGGRGANVTLPFKEQALRFADRASARAQVAGAANFLVRRGDFLEADNTDGAGLVADLERLGVQVRDARVLLVGAGGAARGVIAPLLALAPRRLHLANRSLDKAERLASHFARHGTVAVHRLDAIAPESFDIVINATSTSTKGEPLALPAGVIRAGSFAYDMAYGPAARSFVSHARACGAEASDGLGMLVEQAAESFTLWRGRRPATEPVIAELRERFA